MAKSCNQLKEISYNEVYLHVVKYYSISVFMTIVNKYILNLDKMDVKKTFLKGDIKEKIYMEQPESFVEDKSKVCILKKYLYGLKKIFRK